MIESCRNTFNQLVSHVSVFLGSCLAFDRDEVDEEAAAGFYCALRVPADGLQEYVEVAPLFIDGVLHVRRSLLDDVAAMEQVIAVWLHAMRWTRFSETRWLPVWLSARGMLRTLHMGVERLMEVTRASPYRQRVLRARLRWVRAGGEALPLSVCLRILPDGGSAS